MPQEWLLSPSCLCFSQTLLLPTLWRRSWHHWPTLSPSSINTQPARHPHLPHNFWERLVCIQVNNACSVFKWNHHFHLCVLQLEKLVGDVLGCLQTRIAVAYDDELLALLSPLLCVLFLHKSKQLRSSVTSFWNSTFANSVSLTYPNEIRWRVMVQFKNLHLWPAVKHMTKVQDSTLNLDILECEILLSLNFFVNPLFSILPNYFISYIVMKCYSNTFL